jgi:hypothetical protein
MFAITTLKKQDKQIAELKAENESMKCCGNCSNHSYYSITREYRCQNKDSNFFKKRMSPKDKCDNWQRREE